jgi:caffeoyl-CoA O-methyltransferase
MNETNYRPTAEPYYNSLLPNQPLLRELFLGDDAELARALYEFTLQFSDLGLSDKFVVKQSPEFTLEQMATSPAQLKFMQFLIMLTKSRSILEVGTFVGISTMYLARALPPGGKVVTLEKYDHFAAIAEDNFHANGLTDSIELVCGDAMDYLIKQPKAPQFDCIFLDGCKERYDDFFDVLDPLLTKGGLMIVDDVLFVGDVLNAKQQTPKGQGCRRYLAKAEKMASYRKVFLPFRNGLHLMQKI